MTSVADVCPTCVIAALDVPCLPDSGCGVLPDPERQKAAAVTVPVDQDPERDRAVESLLPVPLLSNLVADLLLKGKNFSMLQLALGAGP